MPKRDVFEVNHVHRGAELKHQLNDVNVPIRRRSLEAPSIEGIAILEQNFG
jgi:hypothetical protein